MKIAAIITHHMDAHHEYLNLCLESLRRQEGIQIDPILIATTLSTPQINVELPKLKVIRKDRPFSTAQAYNLGEKYADPDCTHVLILNDDIILSKFLCRELATAVGESVNIVNPLCSSESDYVFGGDVEISGKSFKRFMSDKEVSFTLEDVSGYEEAIMNWPVGQRLLFPIIHGYNPFHCTMMHRGLWRDLNGMDERFFNQKDDLDFCNRARIKHKSMSLMSIATFAFHFGGVTAKHTITDDMRKSGEDTYRNIWGISKDGVSLSKEA